MIVEIGLFLGGLLVSAIVIYYLLIPKQIKTFWKMFRERKFFACLLRKTGEAEVVSTRRISPGWYLNPNFGLFYTPPKTIYKFGKSFISFFLEDFAFAIPPKLAKLSEYAKRIGFKSLKDFDKKKFNLAFGTMAKHLEPEEETEIKNPKKSKRGRPSKEIKVFEAVGFDDFTRYINFDANPGIIWSAIEFGTVKSKFSGIDLKFFIGIAIVILAAAIGWMIATGVKLF